VEIRQDTDFTIMGIKFSREIAGTALRGGNWNNSSNNIVFRCVLLSEHRVRLE
jgi:hypothetical protein